MKFYQSLRFLSIPFFIFLTLSAYSQFHCSFGDNHKIEKHPEITRSINEPVEVKITFWNMCKSDGTLCHDMVELQELINSMKLHYANYNIILNECLIQNNSDLQHHKDNFTINMPINCETMNFHFYHTTGFGTGGVIGPFGHLASSWLPNTYTLTHELGHMFGLLHPFNNCENNPEMVKRPDCDPAIDPNCPPSCVVNCETAGDGLCDTPADSQDNGGQGSNPICDNVLKLVWDPVDQSFNLENTGNFTDNCGVLYHDDNDVLITNFMSYDAPYANSFTTEQVCHMHNVIDYSLSEFIGDIENCPSSPYSLGDIQSGSIEDQSLVIIDNIDLTLFSLHIKNSNVRIQNSTIGIEKNIQLENSNLVIINSNFQSGCFGGFGGIDLNDNSYLTVKGESSINNIRILGEGCWIHLSDCTVSNTQISTVPAIKSVKDAFIHLYDNVQVQGAIQVAGDGSFDDFCFPWIEGPCSPFLIINNSLVDANDYWAAGIETYDYDFICTQSEISNSTIAMSITNGGASIAESHLHNFALDGMYFYDLDYLNLTGNYIEGTNTFGSNPINYDISYNKFYNCLTNQCINAHQININSDNNIENKISNNIIDVPSRGIRSTGDQTKLKFLCNEFLASTQYNFDWQIVDPIQGENIGFTSGNLFSNTSDQIKGNSLGSFYLFNENNSAEVLDNFTNISLTPSPVTNNALGCVNKGPNFLLTDNDNQILFDIPNTVGGCSLGIDCSELCPSGINCSQPCPPGINCLEDCPFGIDCTQPCPLGVDCFEPCPPGVNCLEPVTPLFPQNPAEEGTEESDTEDPVLNFLDEMYNSYYQELTAFKTEEKSRVLKSTVIDRNTNWKEHIEKYIATNNLKIEVGLLLEIFRRSYSFTEEEVVSMILNNPENLFDKRILKVVFGTSSFKDSNQKRMMEIRENWLNTEEALSFTKRYELESKLSRISKYALQRLKLGFIKDPFEENIWYSRLNSLSAELAIVDNLFRSKDFSDSFAHLAELKNNTEYSNLELQDLEYYETVLNILLQASENNITLSNLDNAQIELLETISSLNLRYSSSKARGILRTFHERELEMGDFLESQPEKLEFIKPNISSNRASFNDKLKIYPTVTNGAFIVENFEVEEILFELYSIDGRNEISRILDHGKTELHLTLNKGIYLFKIRGFNGKEFVGKLIIN